MTTKITLSIISALMISTMAIADEAAVETSKELKQSLNFGFANTTGNTETLNLNAKYLMGFTTEGYNNEALNVSFDASGFITESNDVRSAEQYTVNLGLEQYITDGWMGYASVNWLRDEFQGFENKYSIGAGMGKELFNDGQHSLKAKIGVSYNIESYTTNQAERKYTSLNEYLEYNNKLNDVSNLYVQLGASENFDDFSGDYEVLSVIGFNFAVAKNINITLEEEIRYDKITPEGLNANGKPFDDLDTKTIIRVGYNF